MLLDPVVDAPSVRRRPRIGAQRAQPLAPLGRPRASAGARVRNTEFRGDAFAWSNNLMGRLGYVIAPLAVGFAAADFGWGASVAVTAIFPIFALGLIIMLQRGRREKMPTAA